MKEKIAIWTCIKILKIIRRSKMIREMIDKWQEELLEKAGKTESKLDDLAVKVLNAVIDVLQEIL